MYNDLQPMASLLAVAIGMDTSGVEKALSVVLVFSGVYIVTQSKNGKRRWLVRKKRVGNK